MEIFLRIIRKEIEKDTLSIYAFYSYIYSFSFYLSRDTFSLYVYNSYSYSYPLMSMTFSHDGQKDFTQGILLLALLNVLPDDQAQNLDSLTKEWDFAQVNFSGVPLFCSRVKTKQNQLLPTSSSSILQFRETSALEASFQILSELENYRSNFQFHLYPLLSSTIPVSKSESAYIPLN